MPGTGRRPGSSGTSKLPEANLVAVDRRLDEVHRRRADEPGDEDGPRLLVEALRRVDLEDPAVSHDRDALSERHRLDLVVRDVDRRDAEPRVELRERRAHPDPELRVEVRERLVHEERLRLAHDRAAHRDALPLTAGQLRGPALEQILETEHAGHLVDPTPDLGLSACAAP